MPCSSATSIANLKYLVSLTAAQDAGPQASADRSREHLRNQQLAFELVLNRAKFQRQLLIAQTFNRTLYRNAQASTHGL